MKSWLDKRSHLKTSVWALGNGDVSIVAAPEALDELKPHRAQEEETPEMRHPSKSPVVICHHDNDCIPFR